MQAPKSNKSYPKTELKTRKSTSSKSSPKQ